MPSLIHCTLEFILALFTLPPGNPLTPFGFHAVHPQGARVKISSAISGFGQTFLLTPADKVVSRLWDLVCVRRGGKRALIDFLPLLRPAKQAIWNLSGPTSVKQPAASKTKPLAHRLAHCGLGFKFC